MRKKHCDTRWRVSEQGICYVQSQISSPSPSLPPSLFLYVLHLSSDILILASLNINRRIPTIAVLSHQFLSQRMLFVQVVINYK